MYESCFVTADQTLVLVCAVLAIALLGLLAALERQIHSARHYREQFHAAVENARRFKRERDDFQTRLLFPDRQELRHG